MMFNVTWHRVRISYDFDADCWCLGNQKLTKVHAPPQVISNIVTELCNKATNQTFFPTNVIKYLHFNVQIQCGVTPVVSPVDSRLTGSLNVQTNTHTHTSGSYEEFIMQTKVLVCYGKQWCPTHTSRLEDAIGSVRIRWMREGV